MNKVMKVLMLSLLMMVYQTISVKAESSGGYSVAPILSQYQTKGVTNFFDIRWTPKKTDVIGLRITNKDNKEQTYTIEINKAETNRNGIVDYSNKKAEKENAKLKIKDVLKIEKTIKVPANSEKTVKGEVLFPSENFNGIFLAGIHVSKKAEEDKSKGVSNTVAYNIPLVLRGNIDKRPEPKIDLTKVNIEKFTSKQYSVYATLNNSGPNLLKDVKFKATIENDKGEVVETQESAIDITPETEFIYPIKLTSKYKAGDYTLKLHLLHNKDDKWDFSKKFTITDEDTKNIKAVTETDTIKWYLIGGSLFILCGITLFIWIKKRRK